ncbi:MAG TPA: phenylalanine--tRNA ligase subunit beta, partial [Chloroflexota bacterium]|nr:phenylalanine--tRNA ligase subunit beta [Chloroflexota bacterium]
MNVPYSWLREFIPELPPLEEVADLLPRIGLGVERVFELPAPPAGAVVARVTRVTPLEGSDHLTVCRVDDGAGEHTVVCGAPNVRAPMLTAFAQSGTRLPAVDLTVETREIVGVASEGMLCSPAELGLYDYAGGLIVFGEDAPVGANLAELWPGEWVLELEITPNRADAFSILGVARDLAAKLGVPYKHPAADLTLASASVDDGLTVNIEDPTGCPRFTLQRIDGVTVGPSPVWLQRRLASVGLRPRNNVVDVTNFVTFELGQPSHAYDLDNLTENTLTVRRARAGETLQILTQETLVLNEDDLIIAMPDGSGTKP